MGLVFRVDCGEVSKAPRVEEGQKHGTSWG